MAFKEEKNDEGFDFLVTFKYLTAGGIAGAVSRTVVSPLERTKILFQVLPQHEKPPSVYKCLKEVYIKEGMTGFFKGNGTNVIRIVPYSAFQFAAYEQYKQLLCDEEGELNTVERLTAGAMAGVTSATLTYPLDLIRTRLSAQKEGAKKYKGIVDCFKVVLREEGGFLSGCLFRGLTPTLLGVAPYVALNFTVYETLKSVLSSHYGLEKHEVLPVPHRLACGALAGAAAQTVAYPLDLVRRRMQMKGIPGSHFQYSGTFDALRTIVTHDGWRGLYRGLLPNYYKVMPSISVSFVVYEFCMKRLI